MMCDVVGRLESAGTSLLCLLDRFKENFNMLDIDRFMHPTSVSYTLGAFQNTKHKNSKGSNSGQSAYTVQGISDSEQIRNKTARNGYQARA